MIRCIPIDGSDPFEVENWEGATDGHLTIGVALALDIRAADDPPLMVHGVLCRIESWRERAERLERDLANRLEFIEDSARVTGSSLVSVGMRKAIDMIRGDDEPMARNAR